VADGAILHIAIVGAGATGVELAAELHNTTRVLATYGLAHFDPEKQIRISIVEAGPRILPGLPDYVAEETLKVLEGLGVEVFTGQKVVQVSANAVKTAEGREIPGGFIVWAAGIRGAEVLATLGLETDRINRLVVKPTLETTRDPAIFALGDCAACPWTEGKVVPPRAQAAHQQASHLVATIRDRLAGRPGRPFRYRDFGSLISLGHYDTVGQLMGFIGGGRMRVEGFLARLFYVALYRLHIWALYGFWRMALDTLARLIKRQTEPKVKLH
jgi:NADH dehydrogenase